MHFYAEFPCSYAITSGKNYFLKLAADRPGSKVSLEIEECEKNYFHPPPFCSGGSEPGMVIYLAFEIIWYSLCYRHYTFLGKYLNARYFTNPARSLPIMEKWDFHA